MVTEFYLPALARLGWTTGITVTDRSADVLAKTAQIAPWAATRALGFQEVLGDRVLAAAHDAVVVAVPNSLHVAAVEAALRAGLPVLCEKPLALQAAECQRLGELAASLKLPLAVGMVRRHIPAHQAAAAAIQSGMLGRLLRVEVCHGGPYGWTSDSGAFFRRENGGVLADLGVHHLDWLANVLGPLTPVAYEDDAQGGVEAGFVYDLKTESAVPVRIAVSYRHKRPDTTTFIGERARLVVHRNRFDSCQLIGLAPGVEAELRPEHPFIDVGWPRDFISCFAQQFHEFAALVHGQPAATVSARAATAIVQLIEHAYAHRPAQRAVTESRPGLPSGRVMVTGGTGFIGGAVLQRLTELGFTDVFVPVRGFRTCANAARFPVELCRMDLLDRVSLQRSLTGVRWLFHLAYGVEDSEARKVTVDGTRVMIEAAAAAGVEAVVVLSTAGVFGQPETDELVDESWPYRPAYGNYGKTKMDMEKWLLNWCANSGTTRVVVLNPTCVFGPDGKTYTRLPAELAQAGQFAWVDGGRGIVNYVYVDNLVDAMLTVATRSEARGQRYLVTDGYCTWREFLGVQLGELAEAVPNLSLAEFRGLAELTPRATTKDLLRAIMNNRTFMETADRHPWIGSAKRMLSRRLRGQVQDLRQVSSAACAAGPPIARPVPWLVELFGPTRTRFSSAKLQQLGWRPCVALTEGQRQSVAWLKRAGVLK